MMLMLRTLGMKASVKKRENDHPSYMLREHSEKVFREHFSINWSTFCHCTHSGHILISTRLEKKNHPEDTGKHRRGDIGKRMRSRHRIRL